jgi:Holliday junction resolvasome RuvABC ATP-dependent DNA helicase subunit
MPVKDKVDPRLRAVYKDVTELVGVDGPRDELIKWLIEKEGGSLRFVSIVGYGGLGKTTLATQIRTNLRAGATFECGAFVSISRKPDMKAILRSILSQVSKQDSAYSALDDVQLIYKIREFLQDRR